MNRESKNLPAAADLKTKSLARKSLRHPLTLAGGSIGLLGLVGLLGIGPTLVVFAVIAGGLTLAVLNWMFQFFLRRNHHESQALEERAQAFEDQEREQLRKLRRELSRVQYAENPDPRAELASERLQSANAQVQSLKKELAAKFEPGELTQVRYLQGADRVWSAVISNTQQIAASLQSLINADWQELKKRRTNLEHSSTGETIAELQALEERLKLHDQASKRVDELLAANERALTELERVTQAIAALRTSKSGTTIDLEAALKDLEDLARRANQYSS